METVELKNKLVDIINSSDERFLRMVKALHQTYNEDISVKADIVAYTFKGTPLTKTDIVKNNREAINSIERGEFKTHSQIRQKYVSQ
ncbi:hypothetical protein [Polaribacter cellanae]|uniref:Uncharacterized protein n=1 Tax=Polaribacter cellanae TaxID=2818493 RepID=A0A975CL41_9FLAO|nr:hypothetical protein [Polaribacter cellanae]QTE21097.1 hypothetical protein J3359_09565 [Polaribacter cellanae]